MGPSKLPDIAMSCLRSWSPQPQILWTYSAMEQLGIVGLTIKALDMIMLPGTVAFMLAGNVPVQFLKDILSMGIVHRCGGLFMDMDMYWLGQNVQLHGPGFLFPEEPHGRRTGLWLGRSHPYPNLAMFAMPKGAELARSLARTWEDRWFGHAHAVLDGHVPAVDSWDTHHDWMWNTRSLQLQLSKDPQLMQAFRAPIWFCPFSKTLTMDIYNRLEQAEEHSPCLVNDLAIDYKQPSMKTIARHSMCLNLWHRQWTKPLQDKVMAQCATIRAHNLSRFDINAMVNTTVKQVDTAIMASIETVLLLLGRAVGHTVMGFVYAMFEAPWLQQLLRPMPQVPDGAKGGSGCSTGQGPWAGPPISADHWCGALLFLALTLLCSPDHERSVAQGSNPRAVATPRTGPAVDSALDFAVSMDSEAWPGVKRPVQAIIPCLLSHYNTHSDYTWPQA
jgi:hypothetical protein